MYSELPNKDVCMFIYFAFFCHLAHTLSESAHTFILGSNATLYVNWAYFWVSRLVLALDMLYFLSKIRILYCLYIYTGIAWLAGVYVPFSQYCFNFMCPSMWKRKRLIILMCLLEFECAKRLKAQSRAIPVYIIPLFITGACLNIFGKKSRPCINFLNCTWGQACT